MRQLRGSLIRLAAFAAGLVALAGLGFGLGRLLDLSAPGGEQGAAAMSAHAAGSVHGADPVRGLAVAADGLRLVVANPEWRRGATAPLRFQIVDRGGAPLTEFETTHTRRMHVVVVRRDLTGFQHLHPTIAADGTWTAPLRLAAAGSHRVFADFSRRGEAVTLAADLRVDGGADLRELPAPATRARSEPGGYAVSLAGAGARAGQEATLRFAVSRDGRTARLQPYLGAGGHLVALREGDLGFLHVHPAGDRGEDGTVEFETTFPTAGRYRLFLQFEVAGQLQTVAFTTEVH